MGKLSELAEMYTTDTDSLVKEVKTLMLEIIGEDNQLIAADHLSTPYEGQTLMKRHLRQKVSEL